MTIEELDLGRKPYLVIGTVMMIFFLISTWFFSIQTDFGKVLQYIACFISFDFSFIWTWGSVPWVF